LILTIFGTNIPLTQLTMKWLFKFPPHPRLFLQYLGKTTNEISIESFRNNVGINCTLRQQTILDSCRHQ